MVEHFFHWVKCVLFVVGADISVGAVNRVCIRILDSKLLATEVASRSGCRNGEAPHRSLVTQDLVRNTLVWSPSTPRLFARDSQLLPRISLLGTAARAGRLCNA